MHKVYVFDLGGTLMEYKVACLTDLPNGMPDNMFLNAIKDMVDLFDLYVSSQSCGV